jgi:phosphatidyl-myo-inositol dimannoside synthase
MSKKMRILSIGHSYVVAMNRSILREIASDPQFEVVIGAPKTFNGSLRAIQLEPEPQGSKIKLIGIDAYFTQKMHLFFYNPLQLKKIMKTNFDMAHFWEEPYILSGYQLANQAKKNSLPYLFRTAQSLVKDYIFPFNYFEKQSVKYASTFVAGGHLVHNAMKEKNWNINGQVLTLAVDTHKFRPIEIPEKLEKIKKIGLQGPLLGFLGRLSEEKGIDLIMETLLPLKNYPWSFLFMGSGPYKEKILNWAKKNNLTDRIKILLLKHEEVPHYLPLCDLLLCPSQTRDFWKEQFGRMIVEAFASGVPVMASDSGEIPRVVSDAGLILPEANKIIWQEKVKGFLESPKSFDIFKQKGLERVEKFSAKTIAQEYKNLYLNSLNTKSNEDGSKNFEHKSI